MFDIYEERANQYLCLNYLNFFCHTVLLLFDRLEKNAFKILDIINWNFKRVCGNFEWFSQLTIFTLILSLHKRAILEHEKISSITVSWKVLGLFAVFTLCMFAIYSCMPLIMKISSATVVNISILTADLFALFVGHFLFHQKVSLFFISNIDQYNKFIQYLLICLILSRTLNKTFLFC